ncbi:DUF6456 domain-containing protein [Celeribacter neptunius]|uniref:DUF6456 domain-containing protein n=1 Tax=Celeribacter neptunius TaxID=588602 RepID=A0A1I3LKL1_9RHOB|nr:DUF6456 domain-containing protein [Celeribacter neptunius]SFI85291.1 hypothetical protein SAMN04487991_1067 [Celeribacter neptunius]
MLEIGKGLPPRTGTLPKWVPKEAVRYLAHTERGNSLRELARRDGCAPSTVLRQVRRLELKRDDPLIDEALNALRRLAPERNAARIGGDMSFPKRSPDKEPDSMTEQSPFDETPESSPPDDATILREARRVLRRLCEPGACLAVARDMDKAVVVRDLPDGRTTRTAVLDRTIAQAMALKDWISATTKGQIRRYTITAAGRAALREILAQEEGTRAGFAEAPMRFGLERDGALDAPEERAGPADGSGAGVEPARKTSRRIRYQAAESPILVLARRRDKHGEPFLAPELVAVAERLREDFELAQMAPHVTQNWDRFLTGRIDAGTLGDVRGFGIEPARARLAAALSDLGPGLGDVALRCCCYLEGMEQAEKRMGWSARSGKIVLRIALQRLKKHYDAAGYSNLIG